MKKYLYYTLAILVFSSLVWFVSYKAHGNNQWVRAQYQGAVRCYSVGEEPKNMKYKHYYPTFDKCDETIGHAV